MSLRSVPPTARRAGLALLEALGVRRAPSRTTGPSLQRIVDDLHRLDAELGLLMRGDPRTPALYQRLRAVSWAYDHTLRDACVVVGVPAPDHAPPLDRTERLTTEAQLSAAGLRW